MKIEVKSYTTIGSLLIAIIFFVIGALLFTNSDAIVKWLSYIIGGLLILWGLFKLIKYLIQRPKDAPINNTEITLSVMTIVLGIVCLFLISIIVTAFRLIAGAWILFTGISRLIGALTSESLKGRKNIILMCVSALLIIAGLYLLLNGDLLYRGIGLVIMIYAGIDIVGYIFTQSNRYQKSPDEAVVIEYAEKKPKKEKKKKEDH